MRSFKISTSTYLYWLLLLFHGFWLLKLHEAFGLEKVFTNQIRPYLLLDVFPPGMAGVLFIIQANIFLVLAFREARDFRPEYEEKPFRLLGYVCMFLFFISLFIQLTVLVFGPFFERGVA